MQAHPVGRRLVDSNSQHWMDSNSRIDPTETARPSRVSTSLRRVRALGFPSVGPVEKARLIQMRGEQLQFHDVVVNVLGCQ